MSWIDDLNSKADVGGVDDSLSWNKYAQWQMSKKMPQKQKEDDKGFWLDQISTGGGIAGALGGAAAGAAAGSVVPVFGTAVGGILGAILGGSAGSGGGEFAENVITDEENKFKDVGTEALIGGATSLPITGGLKLLRAGTKAATGLGKRPAGELVQEAGVQSLGRGTVKRGTANGSFDESAIQALDRLGARKSGSATDSLGNVMNPSKRTKFGTAMEDYGAERAWDTQGNLTRADVRRIGDFDPVETMKYFGSEYGMTNLDDMTQLGRFATGGAGKEDGSAVLTNIIENAVRSGKGVDLDNLGDIIAPLKGRMDSGDIKKLDDYVLRLQDQAGFATTHGGDNALNPNLADPIASLKAARDARSNGMFYKNAANPSPSQEALGEGYNSIGRELKTRTYDRQLSIDGASSLSDDAQAALRDGVQQLRTQADEYVQAGNKQFGKSLSALADKIEGAKNLQDLDRLATPFVQASEAAKLSTRGSGNAAANVGGLKQSALGQVNDALGVPIGAATQRIGSQVAKGGRKLRGGTSSPPKIGQSVPGAAARQFTGRALTGQSMGEQTQQPQTLESALTAGAGQPGPEATQTPSNPFGVSQEEVATALMRAMVAGDEDAVEQLQGMHDLIGEYEEAGQQGQDLGYNEQKMVMNAESGLQSINDLESMIQSDPSIVNRAAVPDNSLLNTALGTSKYRAAITNAQDAMVRLRSGAAMNEMEATRFDRMLPRFGDSAEDIQYKLSQFKGFYNKVIGNAGSGGGDAGGLEAALASAGYQ